jgi:hypothetical protein
VSFAEFTAPTYWGSAFDQAPKKFLYYAWSHPDSRLIAYSYEKGSVTQPLECTNYIWPSFITNARVQYLTLQLKLAGDYTLKAGDVFILEDFYTARPSDLYTLPNKPCSVRGETSSFNLSSCIVSQFDSNKLRFTLNIKDTTTAKGDIFITFFAEHISNLPTSQYFHGFKVLLYDSANFGGLDAANKFNIIEECYSKVTSRRFIPRSLENTLSNRMNLTFPQYINNTNARSTISVRFGITDKRQLWDDSLVSFDFGFLTTPNNLLSGDIRCYLLDESRKISFDWISIDAGNLKNLMVYPKR